jgi:hypothetical protein
VTKANKLAANWFWITALVFLIIVAFAGVQSYLRAHLFDFTGYTLKLGKSEIINDSLTTINYNYDKSKFVYSCVQLRTSEMMLIYHNQNIPLRIRECKLTNSKRKTKALVWIHGGPFVKMSEEMPPEQSAYLVRGYTIIEPIYAGNLEKLPGLVGKVFKNDVDDALETVETVMKFANSRYNKVDLFGESFGGFLVPVYLSKKPILKPDSRIILMNMMYYTPRRNYLDEGAVPTDQLPTKTEYPPLDAKVVYEGKDQIFKDFLKDQVKISKFNMTHYFADFLDVSPFESLTAAGNDYNLYFITGGKDKIVCTPCINAFAKTRKPARLLSFAENGHESIKTRAQQEQFEQFLFNGSDD